DVSADRILWSSVQNDACLGADRHLSGHVLRQMHVHVDVAEIVDGEHTAAGWKNFTAFRKARFDTCADWRDKNGVADLGTKLVSRRFRGIDIGFGLYDLCLGGGEFRAG